MPTSTTRISIPVTNYVAVSNGDMNVFIRPVSPAPLRLHVGQSLPSAETPNYLPLNASSLSLSDLEGDDKVYLRAEAEGSEVVVIKGG